MKGCIFVETKKKDMKTSLELMTAFTDNRKPTRVYSQTENQTGELFRLSEKQDRWLLSLLYKIPGFDNRTGATYTDANYAYTYVTKNGVGHIRKASHTDLERSLWGVKHLSEDEIESIGWNKSDHPRFSFA